MSQCTDWNKQALRDWLRSIQYDGVPLCEFAQESRIPYKTLQEWMMLPVPRMTQEHIELIADYRQWSVDRTQRWLGILSGSPVLSQ